jgi:hypothetical protein
LRLSTNISAEPSWWVNCFRIINMIGSDMTKVSDYWKSFLSTANPAFVYNIVGFKPVS